MTSSLTERRGLKLEWAWSKLTDDVSSLTERRGLKQACRIFVKSNPGRLSQRDVD